MTLRGTLQIALAEGFVPEIGEHYELIQAGELLGNFDQVIMPAISGATIKMERTASSLSLVLQKDNDNDGVADIDDNCALAPNGTAVPDSGGHVQRDTDNDGFGNLCDSDLNNDGVTNQLDAVLFRAALGTSNANADFNGDGGVNQLDASILRAGFGKAPGPSRQAL